MQKRFLGMILVIFVAFAASGCEAMRKIFPPSEMVVYNACKGSWVSISDGKGKLLSRRIEYGGQDDVDLNGYAGSSVQLIASGFEIGSDRVLGVAMATPFIPYTSVGSMTGPSQVPPWKIDSLSTTDQNGGCRK